jgi:hypothetical protein
MRFSVQSDLDRLSKKLTHQQKEQIPFATSLALNETANDVSRAITAQMDRYLDNPTPFTKQAYIGKNGKFRGDRSNKKRLFVDIKPGKVQAAVPDVSDRGRNTQTPPQGDIGSDSRIT